MEFQSFDKPAEKVQEVVSKPPPSTVQPFLTRTTEVSKSLLMTSYATSIQSINIGFSLAAALAWNDVVKEYALKNLSVKKSQFYGLVYASIVTLLSAFVFMVTKMFLDDNIKRANLTPVVGFR